MTGQKQTSANSLGKKQEGAERRWEQLAWKEKTLTQGLTLFSSSHIFQKGPALEGLDVLRVLR